LPANAGFNVFGPMPVMTFSNAEGSLLVDDREVPIGAPATVRLSDIRALHELSEGESIPIPLSVTENTARLTFRGVGDVKVNGQDEDTFFQRNRQTLEVIGLVVALIGCFFTVGSFALGVLGKEPRSL
jgi:hypothetical protein